MIWESVTAHKGCCSGRLQTGLVVRVIGLLLARIHATQERAYLLFTSRKLGWFLQVVTGWNGDADFTNRTNTLTIELRFDST